MYLFYLEIKFGAIWRNLVILIRIERNASGLREEGSGVYGRNDIDLEIEGINYRI